MLHATCRMNLPPLTTLKIYPKMLLDKTLIAKARQGFLKTLNLWTYLPN